MKRISRELVVGIFVGIVIGAVLFYAVHGKSRDIRTCPVVNHETLVEYLVNANLITGGEATAKAVEEAYLEQRSPNYPLEIFKEMYRKAPGRKKFIGLSYVFVNDHLLYGRFSISNETSLKFEFESPTKKMSQRIDGAGIITPRWAVIFVSLYDFEGTNGVEELRLVVPKEWKLEYYGGTGKILAESVLRVRFSSIKKDNYVVFAFKTVGVDNPPYAEIVIDGDSYRLMEDYSST
ncbi:hypothetical protein NF865_09570 [Thermococcus aggregans]|uniref:Uncharacterized protein n=1 Tax=Thermococcus aggregans TaxID=110163 RepID=A0A9E7MX35_THEAG|nr:hypothetical protein [Thermococcus aggregans]USS40531.1 hypothetical protein NF865_09570 [Thermococcus aggregans]